jgi:L-alanine-DL-glutamate epimerase-like enolase superfamily enzyme
VKIADVRVVLADIPVKRPHKMSFTTLEAVNFAFVRLETADGLIGWGEAACLGGPTWSEESSESVAVTIERYIAPWLVGGHRAAMARRATRSAPPSARLADVRASAQRLRGAIHRARIQRGLQLLRGKTDLRRRAEGQDADAKRLDGCGVGIPLDFQTAIAVNE